MNSGSCVANTCSFGVSATYCNCDYCDNLDEDKCISTCPDPYKDASCTACSDYGCSAGCHYNGFCYDCDVGNWPTCKDGVS